MAVASHPDPGLRPLPLCPWRLPSPRDSRLPTEAVQGNESIPRRRISKTPNLLSALLTWPSKTVAWLSSGLVALCRKIRPFIVVFFFQFKPQAYFPEAESQRTRQVERNKLVCYFPDLQISQNRWSCNQSGARGEIVSENWGGQHAP